MARRTLIDFFDDLGNISGEFLVFDDGYRSWSYSYRDTTDRARSFAARLHAEGITRGQHVVIWSENRPEWIVALWGCLLRGAVLVPIDYRASADFLLFAPFDSEVDHPLYDHDYGPTAAFWITVRSV